MERKTDGGVKIQWKNGAFLTGAAFDVNDRLRLGDGVFDTMLAADGVLIHPDRHFLRLALHADVMGIKAHAPFAEIALELLKKNKFREGRAVINTILTRGRGERGIKPPDDPHPTIVVKASPAPLNFPRLKIVIARGVRRNEGSPLSRIKSVNCGDLVLARMEAESRGANEAILLNNKGFAACATSGNVFILKGGKLYTPPLADGAMDGIVRALLLERMGAAESSLTEARLMNADAVYITNSIRGVARAHSVDGRKFAATSLKIPKDFHLK